MDPLSLPACWNGDMVFLEAMALLGLGSPAPNSAVLQSPLEAREEAETRELHRHVSQVVHKVLLAPISLENSG